MGSLSTTEKALGGAAIGLIVAGIIVAAVIIGLSGKKGYDYYKLKGTKHRSVIKDNPLYSTEMDQKSSNPFYQGE